jgi:hypothetical protein
MLRYGLFAWRGKKEALSDEPSFSVHRESGYTIVWATMCAVILIETVLVHLLLWPWSKAAAIVAMALSVYGLTFFLADHSALIKRPIVIRNSKLLLRVGIRWNTAIRLSDIREIKLIKGFDKEKAIETLDCSILRDPNAILELHTHAEVTGLYGIRKTTTKIAFNVDEGPRFIKAILQTQSK